MYRPIAAVLGLVFLVLSVFSGQHFLKDISHNAQMDLIHSAARDLLITLLNAETGQRGYVITGNAEYLAPYESSIGNIDEVLTVLEQSSQDTPHAKEIGEIRPLVKQKLDELALTINKRKQSFDAAATEVNRHIGFNLMAGIRNHLLLLDLWAERAAQVDAKNATFFARSAFFTMIASLLLGMIATFHPGWWKPE